jgi:CRP/FNR family transcriptional regulator, cyclic AMP receptor protein
MDGRLAVGGDLGVFIARRGRLVALRRGQAVFHEGDPSTAVYACVEGSINLTTVAPGGKTVVLGVRNPVEVFGELSALDGARRSATAMATTPSSVSRMTSDEFLEALSEAPTLSLNILRSLSESLRAGNRRVSSQIGDSVLVRVGQRLLDECDAHHDAGLSGSQLSPHSPVTVTTSQDEFARWIGVTREAVARALATLRRAGAIETSRGRIIVLDPALVVSAMQAAPLRQEIPTGRR